ncbi:SDR family NAD(P)-dependent oxidoreductase [Enterococcus sp. AZ109]|uniref:SDR family NAD(P)-dependent oxidoreductase n=1 Tax=Enterococcus sp. AZ109 TaxID=2774634 RepID=UPI003F228302
METILITGGTSGIGYSIAKKFAEQGANLILVSSNQQNLAKAKSELKRLFNSYIITIQQDLSQLGSAKELYQKVQERRLQVDTLINNAGFGLVDATEVIEYQEDEKMMILNMISLVQLCKLFLPDMYQRRAGKILNVASTGAFQPGPYTSTYFASKAFVLSYSKAIRIEARKKGVQVGVLCPGATRTNFFPRENTQPTIDAMQPEVVAKIALRQLQRNQGVVIVGLRNQITQLAPAKLKSLVVGRVKQREISKRKTEDHLIL